MDAIKWIEDDLNRQKRTTNLARTFFVFVLISIPGFMGLGMREGLDDSMNSRLLLPNMIATVFLGFIFKKLFEQNFVFAKNIRLYFVLFLLSLGLATERVFFPIAERTAYSSDAAFFHEFLGCFLKGGLTTFVAGVYLAFVSFTASSLPLRKSRMLISALAGLSGTLMLGFHCDSSSYAHVLLAHVGAGVVMGLLVYLLQELLFVARIKAGIPELKEKIKNIHRL